MNKTCAFCLNWDGKETSYMAECLAKAGMQRRTQFDETCRAWTPGIDEEPKTTQMADMVLSSAQPSLSDLEMFKRSLNANAKALAKLKRGYLFPLPDEVDREFFDLQRKIAYEEISYSFENTFKQVLLGGHIREYRCIDCGKPFYGEYGLGLCKDCLGRWI